MTSAPLVSVILPCYNYGRYLSDALESLLAQTYTTWECIIVNDGSTDETEEVAKRFAQKDTRFKYIYQKNSGVSMARNQALQAAAGTYFQLLDADDILEKDKLKLQVAYLEENPEIDLMYSSMIFFKEADPNYVVGPKLMHDKQPVSGSGEALLKQLLDDNLFLPGCMFFRRSLYEEVGLFKKGIEGIEDWDYCYRAALLQKTFFHDSRSGTCLLVRSHDNNASNNSKTMLIHKIKARLALMEETDALLTKKQAAFSKSFLYRAGRLHKAFLNRDKSRLYLYHDNIFKGVGSVLRHGYYSGKPFFALYDGAYWIKERIKRKMRWP
ncbi:glycosyltransferase family 2 protein [Flavisolibacter tropicus]|uniref:glycosyltransferase family 2 protein n=1 Tax=Flavisolibacter tropicus TaxID=1492898 RepID=UPI00082B0E2D|nr:glycosyltransferase family A protein [Flavisolibacter tropicus]